MRELGCLQWLHLASRISAVGKQYEYLLASILFLLMYTTHGQRNRITNRRLLTGQAYLGFQQQDLDRIAVERQWHLQIGTLAKQDQTDAIALATGDEIARDGLCRGEPIDASTRQLEVLLIHGAG